MLRSLRNCGLIGWGLLMPWMHGALAQEGCGQLRNAYGPFDYRTEKAKLEVVEIVHFLPYVENLSRGATSSTPGGDLDYVLRASPNHHRALLSMMKLAKKEKRDKPIGSNYTISCWFDRAERFAPDDGVVKMLLGTDLLNRGNRQGAVEKLEKALELAGDNANIHYNLGLAYVDLKEYDKALASAHKAYQLGFQLPGLRRKLEKAGKWRDPPPNAAATDMSRDKQTDTAPAEPASGNRTDG